jgi:ribulose-5-phosphate 4-epimerase/fuculose-1-phosphate aldolase
MDESALRQRLCVSAHQLWMRGMIAGSDGLLTAELNRRRYLATPPGKRRINLKPDDLIAVDLDGHDSDDGEVYNERDWRPHRMVHEAASRKTGPDPDTPRATLVANPPALAALLAMQPRSEKINLHGHAAIPVVWLDDKILSQVLVNSRVVMIPSVGVFASGPSIGEAMCSIEHAEHAAQVELLLRQAN